jgi:hypothetical protein
MTPKIDYQKLDPPNYQIKAKNHTTLTLKQQLIYNQYVKYITYQQDHINNP